MESLVPDHLRDEGAAVERQIRQAFHGVDRVGGVSWSGAEVADDWGSDAEVALAARNDKDTRWEELVDDPAWEDEVGIGGFNFLDPIGYRYYIAPAIVRIARRGHGGWLCFALTMDSQFHLNLASRVTPLEAKAIARFLRFMITVCAARNDDIDGAAWEHAHASHWHRFDD